MASTHKSESPATLKAVYGRITGDTTTHQRTIHVHFLRLDSRRAGMIAALMQGSSYHQIGDKYKISAASARECILRALEAMRKTIAQEPRYNHVGRKHAGQDF